LIASINLGSATDFLEAMTACDEATIGTDNEIGVQSALKLRISLAEGATRLLPGLFIHVNDFASATVDGRCAVFEQNIDHDTMDASLITPPFCMGSQFDSSHGILSSSDVFETPVIGASVELSSCRRGRCRRAQKYCAKGAAEAIGSGWHCLRAALGDQIRARLGRAFRVSPQSVAPSLWLERDECVFEGYFEPTIRLER
jgi:hypothetical protein